MGAATYGRKGFKERARASGERPIGAHSRRQQYNRPHAKPTLPHKGLLSKGTHMRKAWTE